MDPTRRYEIFAEAELAVLERWADAILAESDVRILKHPSNDLVMMEVHDPITDGAFFLGEVLIQECRVMVGDVPGYGYALGTDASRALCSAILDAALSGGHPLAAAVAAALEAEAELVRSRHAAESRLLERSRVRFEVLEG
ncbi:MAG TPA: phosphonate C-P lyase system protein PhnG [bacterium]|nr:phosphonate C-P lyase system protein PhnG [bacterium]